MNIIKAPIVELKNVTNRLGGQIIHENLDLTIYENEIFALIGGSGSGKTTLLRNILMLLTPVKGEVKIFGTDILHSNQKVLQRIQQRWGVLFQHSALFSSLTLLENIMFPLKEFTDLPEKLMREIALLKISMVGLSTNEAHKYPSELSGGMQKRGSLARALVMDPELLILDEPTAGLDPDSANSFDELILKLYKNLKLNIILVTHDIDTLWHISHRVAFLAQKRVLAIEPIQQLINNTNPIVRNYFGGPRGEKFKLAEQYAK